MTTYSDLNTIRNSNDFINRATQAIANYAAYLLGQTPTTALGANLKKGYWAQQAIQNPSSFLTQLASQFIQDPTITGLPNGTVDTSSLTDTQFNNIVQTAINNTVLAW